MDGLPKIIQGGMGVAISSWRLAQAVSRLGHLGVVAGTALDQVLARRLEDGDPGGHCRRAFDAFPVPRHGRARLVALLHSRRQGPGRALHAAAVPRPRVPSPARRGLPRSANFVEVFLAREGHANPVGINYLEKIQPPHLVSIYGAMLAGVDYILMGAGIPLKIPGVLDAYVNHEPATYPLVRRRGAWTATTRRCTSGRGISWNAICRRSSGPGSCRSSRRTSWRPRC